MLEVEATATQHNNNVVVTIQPKKKEEEGIVPAEFSDTSDTTATSSSTSSNASVSVNNEDNRKSLSNSSSSSSLRRLEQELYDALQQQKHRRRSSLQMVALWNDLGTVCRDAGNLEQAESYYQQALKLCSEEEQQQQRQHPEEDPSLVDSLSAMLLGNLGLVSSDLGKRTEAAQLYRRALDKLKEGPPESSDTTTHESKQKQRQLNTARTLNNLGTLSAEQGQYDEARKHFQQALDVYHQTLVTRQDTSDDSTTAITNSSSTSSSSSGRGAAKLGRRQVDDRLKTPDVGLCYHNLGRLSLDQQQFEEAALYLETALNIHDFHHQQTLAHAHVSPKPRMANLENLGELCVEMGRFAKALDYYQQVLDILHQQQQQQQQSSNVEDDAEEETSTPKDLERILGILGSLSYELGQLEQSRDYFLRVLESSDNEGQQGDQDLLGTLQFLGDIASQLGQPDEVSKYQQKIDQILLKREEGLGLDEKES